MQNIKETSDTLKNIKETSDTLRGPKVNARKHWDGESWILEDAKNQKTVTNRHKLPDS